MTLNQIYEIARKKWGETPEHFTDKGSWHSYIDTYQEVLSSLETIKMLEVGISSGGSVWLWREFCLQNNKHYNLTSMDIRSSFAEYHPEFQDPVKTDSNIKLLWNSNCMDPKTYENFNTFNLIVDDGPHTLESQAVILTLALPKLEKNGIYIIEDITSESNVDFLEKHAFSIDSGLETTKYFGYKNGRPDDILLVLRKK